MVGPKPIGADDYRRHHYVPVWYQRRFLKGNTSFRALDLKPNEYRDSLGRISIARSIHSRGPKKLFVESDLYTTFWPGGINTEIERFFFGRVDARAPESLDFWQSYDLSGWSERALQDFLLTVSLQRLRTPRGLSRLARLLKEFDRNKLLIAVQEYQTIFCAHLTEAVWQIVRAPSQSGGFLLTDNPVTIYNEKLRPTVGGRLPEMWHNGSHAIFPLSHSHALIWTNLSWVRNPYAPAEKLRPNPDPLRTAWFDFREVQIGRELSVDEMHSINYILKYSSDRYIAAIDEESLFPERQFRFQGWKHLSKDWMLMPDPRGVTFGGELVIGWKDGKSSAFDEYGRRPWQSDFAEKKRNKREWETFHRFQGDFAKLYGPERRGRSMSFDRLDPEIDDEDYHQYHLKMARKFRRLR